jgi:hypothetical protein
LNVVMPGAGVSPLSLTFQLYRGELGRWFRYRMPGATIVAEEVARATARVASVHPPHGAELGARHWVEVGGTFGARMAAVVEQAPPYYGLFGLVAARLLTRAAAHRIAAGFPSHRSLRPAEAARALDFRPTPCGWRDLGEPWPGEEPACWADVAVGELAEPPHRYHDRYAPTGTIGVPGVERGLARTYGWWSGAADIYRSGTIGADLEKLLAVDEPTVEQLRSLTSAAVVEETARLAERLRASGTLDQLHELARRPGRGAPLGHAGPVFAAHWADGDLLVGDTLVDVKTAIRVDPASKVAVWLWQVLAHAWLDSIGDRYRIRAVALYLSRQGVLVRWPVDELAARMLTRPRSRGSGVDAARDEFLAFAVEIARAESAVLDP